MAGGCIGAITSVQTFTDLDIAGGMERTASLDGERGFEFVDYLG